MTFFPHRLRVFLGYVPAVEGTRRAERSCPTRPGGGTAGVDEGAGAGGGFASLKHRVLMR